MFRVRSISAARSDYRRGCRAAESPAFCRHRAPVHAFRDQCRRAGTVRRRNGPIFRRAVRPADRWWCLPVLPRRNAALDASARNWRSARAMAARSEPGEWPDSAGPAPPPRRRPPPEHTTERASVLLPCRENGPRPRRFPADFKTCNLRTCNFRTCGSGSAKNAPSAASAAVLSD